MPLDPEPGLVIRYDFLWKEEEQRGQQEGREDRPCAIVFATKPKEDGTRTVLLTPVMHSPPGDDETAVEIPHKLARHLGLDDDRSWVRTHEVNTLDWPQNKIPADIVPAGDKWSLGLLPKSISEQVFNQVRENAQAKQLKTTRQTSSTRSKSVRKIATKIKGEVVNHSL